MDTVVNMAVVGKHFPAVTVIVAAELNDQPADAVLSIKTAQKVLGDKFSLIELKKSYNADGLKARNREMLDRAVMAGNPHLFAYWRGIFKSGTYSAICYARKVSVPVQVITLPV